MSFPPGTEMFQFPGFASRPYGFRPGSPMREGFPHSDIRGSTIARISPRLFAACHVLHRLLAPRHPPNALLTLRIATATARTQDRAAPNERHASSRMRGRGSRAIRARARALTLETTQPIPDSPVKEHAPRPVAPGAADAAAAVSEPGTRPEWRRSDSNRRPPACKAGALPAELRPPRRGPAGRPAGRHGPGRT